MVGRRLDVAHGQDDHHEDDRKDGESGLDGTHIGILLIARRIVRRLPGILTPAPTPL